MNVKKNRNQLIISVIIGIAIFMLSFVFFSQQQEQINALKANTGPQVPATKNEYVFAKVALKKGAAITKDNIEVKELPMPMEGAFKTTAEVMDLVLTRDVKEGEILRKNCFAEVEIQTDISPKMGYRAIGISVEEVVYISSLKPEMYIDMYSTGGTIVAENVKVLGIKKSGKSRVVFLEIKDNNISNIIKVMAAGKENFIFILKNQDDSRIYRFTYIPPMSEIEKAYKNSIPDVAPPPPPSVTNYNIEEFVVNEAPPEPEKVEIIRGSQKTEQGF